MTATNPAEVAGLDFSSVKPEPALLRASGFRFVLGYLKPLGPTGPSSLELRSVDVARYRAAGLAVATVWETTADRALGGAAAGTADGLTARSRAVALGYPTTCVCFAAVDFDVQPGQLSMVTAYLAGFAAAWGGPAGAYGSFRLVEHLAAVAPALYLWQTAAWSGGQLSAHAHLYQRTTKHWPDVAGTDEDILCQPLPWYGPTPPPAPVPTPPAPVAPAFDVAGWTAAAGDNGLVFSYLQQWGNATFPSYCAIAPLAPHYGPQTVAFLADFAHRAASDPALAPWAARLRGADGANIGAGLAHALDHYGFGAYLTRVGFRG